MWIEEERERESHWTLDNENHFHTGSTGEIYYYLHCEYYYQNCIHVVELSTTEFKLINTRNHITKYDTFILLLQITEFCDLVFITYMYVVYVDN